MGSTFVARRAGRYEASAATAPNAQGNGRERRRVERRDAEQHTLKPSAHRGRTGKTQDHARSREQRSAAEHQ